MDPIARRLTTLALTVGLALASASQAHADLASVWVAAKTDYVGSTGDLHSTFDKSVGYGAEGGFELLGLDLFGEALVMGTDQYIFTLNLGIDVVFGNKTRLGVGISTGPMLLVFPEPEDGGGLNLNGLSSSDRAAIEGATNMSTTEIESDFNQAASEQEALERYAAGWNLGRLRLVVDHQLVRLVYVGASGQIGYHYVIKGEDATAGANNLALEAYARDKNLSSEHTELLRSALGAKELESNDLNGVNYHFGVFLKVEI